MQKITKEQFRDEFLMRQRKRKAEKKKKAEREIAGYNSDLFKRVQRRAR